MNKRETKNHLIPIIAFNYDSNNNNLNAEYDEKKKSKKNKLYESSFLAIKKIISI